jgi:hypothetical protein
VSSGLNLIVAQLTVMTTASARVPDEDYEWVRERLEEEGVEDGISKLMRTAFSRYKNDKDFRDYMTENMGSESISLRAYASELMDRYNISEEQEEEAIIGIETLIVGVQNRSYTQAVRGGEKLSSINSHIADHTTKYLAGIPESYWNS